MATPQPQGLNPDSPKPHDHSVLLPNDSVRTMHISQFWPKRYESKSPVETLGKQFFTY